MSAPATATPGGNAAKIVLYAPHLCQRICDAVTDFGENLGELVQLLYDTLAEAGGVGLAAPQIGVFDRVAIIHHPDCKLVLVNPEILSREGKSRANEACLSLPGCTARGKVLYNRAAVERAESVVLHWRTPEGEEAEDRFSGFPARVIQHEVDHLDGVFFIDHAQPLARKLVLEKVANFRRRLDVGYLNEKLERKTRELANRVEQLKQLSSVPSVRV